MSQTDPFDLRKHYGPLVDRHKIKVRAEMFERVTLDNLGPELRVGDRVEITRQPGSWYMGPGPGERGSVLAFYDDQKRERSDRLAPLASIKFDRWDGREFQVPIECLRVVDLVNDIGGLA